MTHPSKRKGNTYERELVDDAEAVGLEAERAYASDGRSLGEGKECDLLVRGRDEMILDALRIQAKRRKTVANYLEPPDDADITVIRENYGDSLAVVPWDLFLDLLKNATDGDGNQGSADVSAARIIEAREQGATAAAGSGSRDDNPHRGTDRHKLETAWDDGYCRPLLGHAEALVDGLDPDPR